MDTVVGDSAARLETMVIPEDNDDNIKRGLAISSDGNTVIVSVVHDHIEVYSDREFGTLALRFGKDDNPVHINVKYGPQVNSAPHKMLVIGLLKSHTFKDGRYRIKDGNNTLYVHIEHGVVKATYMHDNNRACSFEISGNGGFLDKGVDETLNTALAMVADHLHDLMEGWK